MQLTCRGWWVVWLRSGLCQPALRSLGGGVDYPTPHSISSKSPRWDLLLLGQLPKCGSNEVTGGLSWRWWLSRCSTGFATVLMPGSRVPIARQVAWDGNPDGLSFEGVKDPQHHDERPPEQRGNQQLLAGCVKSGRVR